MECPNCHKQIPDGSKFCLKCGAIIEQIVNKCSYCGFEGLPDDALFCPKCGSERIEIKEELEQKEKEAKKAQIEEEKTAAQKKQQEDELRKKKEKEVENKEMENNQKEIKLRDKEKQLDKREDNIHNKEIELRQKEVQIKTKEVELNQKETELENERAVFNKEKKDELRKQQAEEKRCKIAEYTKKSQPLKDAINKCHLELSNDEKIYKSYQSYCDSLTGENELISKWKNNSLYYKFGTIHKNYKIKYRWWLNMWIKLNDFSSEGWEDHPNGCKESFDNFCFIIFYPFRFILMILWLAVNVALTPFYIIGFPFYIIGFLWGLIRRVAKYKKLHLNIINDLQQKTCQIDGHKIFNRIAANQEEISKLEKQLSLIETEYQKWI